MAALTRGAVLGRVLRVGVHPNAERLSLCEVDIGAAQAVRIVCGAPNARDAEGGFVAVAPVGAAIEPPPPLSGGNATRPAVAPKPLKIKRSKLRGEASEGMICSLQELGFVSRDGSEDLGAGIWEVPSELVDATGTKPGEPLPATWLDKLNIAHWQDARAGFDHLVKDWQEQASLAQVSCLLEWDQQCIMPADAAGERAAQKSLMARVLHQASTSDVYGERLDKFLSNPALNEFERRSVELAKRDFDIASAVDAQLVQRLTELQSRSFGLWAKARSLDKFKIVQPVLTDLVAATQEAARAKQAVLGEQGCLYSMLLGEHVRDFGVDRVTAMFDEFGAHLAPFVKSEEFKAICEARGQSVLESGPSGQAFELDKQRATSRYLLEHVFGKGKIGKVRLEESAHPFSIKISPNDARVTTRYSAEDVRSSMMGTMHEAGHSLYELGLPQDAHYPAARFLDMVSHESQSLFWERMVGQSKPFADWLAPRLWQDFGYGRYGPDITKDNFADHLYTSLNQLSKTPIRVEADELHYPLHVKVRFELERELVNGTITTGELPERWDAAYHETLGVSPPNQADGVLQDIHWYAGYFGYFPSYSIAAVAAYQLMNSAREQVGDMDEVIRSGNWEPIRKWLGEHVHDHGSMDSSAEAMLERVTGKGFDTASYCEYLLAKYRPA